jgi:hypothetical protein
MLREFMLARRAAFIYSARSISSIPVRAGRVSSRSCIERIWMKNRTTTSEKSAPKFYVRGAVRTSVTFSTMAPSRQDCDIA